MLFASAMFVATSVPANAFLSATADNGTDVRLTAVTAGIAQRLTVETDDSPLVERDGFSVTSAAQIYRLAYRNSSLSFTNNPFGTIQWPFAVGVPISSTFGQRVAPCQGCSSYHEGVDFVPGLGAPIQAIADGVVSLARDSGSDLGTEVTIDHLIGGQLVQSTYGHMKRGSIAMTVGQQVTVGQLVGLVGQTGIATGPHLHLEIRVAGVRVNPFTWLKANAN